MFSCKLSYHQNVLICNLHSCGDKRYVDRFNLYVATTADKSFAPLQLETSITRADERKDSMSDMIRAMSYSTKTAEAMVGSEGVVLVLANRNPLSLAVPDPTWQLIFLYCIFRCMI